MANKRWCIGRTTIVMAIAVLSVALVINNFGGRDSDDSKLRADKVDNLDAVAAQMDSSRVVGRFFFDEIVVLEYQDTETGEWRSWDDSTGTRPVPTAETMARFGVDVEYDVVVPRQY